jgi:hypothetical protein
MVMAIVFIKMTTVSLNWCQCCEMVHRFDRFSFEAWTAHLVSHVCVDCGNVGREPVEDSAEGIGLEPADAGADNRPRHVLVQRPRSGEGTHRKQHVAEKGKQDITCCGDAVPIAIIELTSPTMAVDYDTLNDAHHIAASDVSAVDVLVSITDIHCRSNGRCKAQFN